ncbi:MAG: vitamin K epoxide reductase family protein [Fimbriimonadaceae bacterium]
MVATVLNRILLVLGYAGVFVAGVLSLAALLDKEVPCGGSGGCAAVAADASSHMFGFPNAYLGFVGYVLLAGLATYRELAGMSGPKARFSVTLGWAAAALGTIFSIWLTFISVTQIHQTCKWCLASAAIMTATLFAYMFLSQKLDSAPAAAPRSLAGLFLAPALAVASVAGIGVAMANFTAINLNSTDFRAGDIPKLIGPDAHVKNPNGVVTVIEFGDLDCPNCKHVYPQMEQMVLNSGGRLKLVFHNFPLYTLPEHKGALAGAVVSEIAAEKGKFWDYLDAVYGNGAADPNAPPPDANNMITFGVQLGLNRAELEKRIQDVNDPAFRRVKKDLDLAAEFNITQTPAFIVMAKGQKNANVAGSAIFDVLDAQPYKGLIKGP